MLTGLRVWVVTTGLCDLLLTLLFAVDGLAFGVPFFLGRGLLTSVFSCSVFGFCVTVFSEVVVSC